MTEVLSIIIYVLLIILLLVAIILGIRLLGVLNKVNDIVDNINEKVKILDKLFDIVNVATDRMSMVTEFVVSFISSGFKKIFKPSKKNKKTKREDEIDE